MSRKYEPTAYNWPPCRCGHSEYKHIHQILMGARVIHCRQCRKTNKECSVFVEKGVAMGQTDNAYEQEWKQLWQQ